MGIEDQSVQAHQTIGQVPPAQSMSGNNMMGQGIPNPTMLNQHFQNMAAKLNQLGQLNRQPQPTNFNIGAPMPAFNFGRPSPQPNQMPQFGAMSSSLHKIADQLNQASSGGGLGQIGKFGGGYQGGFGQLGNTGGGPQWIGADKSELQTTNQSPSQMMESMAQQRPFREGGLADAAEHLASKGRNGDTELLHVTKDEIEGLLAAAKERGIHMTRNPHTGIYEASWLSKGLKKLGSNVKSVASKVKNAVGPVFTKIRDAAESAAVLAGNYFVPGSSMLTSQLASKKSQAQLNSGLGKVLQIASGGLGGMAGSAAGAAGGAAANAGAAAGSAGGGFLSNLGQGLKNLGSNALSGAKNIGSAIKSGVTNFVKNPGTTLKSLGSKAMSGIKSLGTKAVEGAKNLGSNTMSGIKNLGSNIKSGVSNLIKDPMGTLKNWGGKIKDAGGKALDFLKEKGMAAKDAIAKLLSPGAGGEGVEGEEGGGILSTLKNMFTDPDRRNQLISGISALYGAKHQKQDPREQADAANALSNGFGLPTAPQASAYQLKQVPNPNYGKPGEPFYITQQFTTPAAATAAAAASAPAAQPPVKAAYGGLMDIGYAEGGVPSYAPEEEVHEYRAGGKLLEGPGDGMSDSIQAEIRGKKTQKALLADGEFVIPADVVSGLGNGSTKAGAKVLYHMMDRVRQARTGTTEQGKQINPNKVIPA